MTKPTNFFCACTAKWQSNFAMASCIWPKASFTRGIEHRPRAAEECHVLIVEPRGVINTGDVVSKLTAAGDRWI